MQTIIRNKAFSKGMSVSRLIFRLWWLWPILAAVVTFFLIMFLSRGQSVWFDEGYSILLAKRPVGDLIALTGVDAHPPLYYLLLKGWAGIFGWSEYALRSLSAVFASLTVGSVFLIIRRLFTIRTAVVVLPFLVLAPFTLRYGYEIRMYAMAGLIGALATLVLVYAYTSKRRTLWIVYGGLVAVGMLTLYMTAAIWITHVIWLFAVTKKNGKTFFRQPWVWSFVLAVVVFAFYIPTLIFQLTHSALPGIGSPVSLTKLADIAGMTISYTQQGQLGGALSLGIIAIVSLVIYLLVSAKQVMPRTQKPGLWLMVALVLIPLLFFALTSLPEPIFVDRYMAHVIIYSYALIGLAAALGWRYGKRLAAIILTIVALIMLVAGVVQLQKTGNFIFDRLQYPRAAEISHAIDCNRQTIIVADNPYTYIDSAYYYNGCDLRFYSKDVVKYIGGYAPLSGSPARLSTSSQVSAPIVYHLHWADSAGNFIPDSRYVLVHTATYDQQVVDKYELTSTLQKKATNR